MTCTYLKIFIASNLNQGIAYMVVQYWIIRSPVRCCGVVFYCLLPPSLDATQVTHVCVCSDMIWFDL